MGTAPPNQGFEMQIVRVISVDAASKKSVVMTSIGLEREVRIDILPTRDQIPKEGEVWVIDQSLGFWSFVGIVDPPGPPSPEVAALQTSVAALQASVTALQSSLATLLAGPGVATTAARSDILSAAGAMLVGQNYFSEFWMPARDFDASLGSPTYASFGGWATNQWGWHFSNGADSGVIGHVYLPVDYVLGTTITGDIFFTDAIGGEVKIDSQFAAIRNGDAMNTTGAIPPGVSNVVAPTGFEQIIVGGCGTASGSPSAGCLLNVAVDRNGTHGSDTNGAIVTFHGVRFRYTAVRR
jgi:hypothetical protein